MQWLCISKAGGVKFPDHFKTIQVLDPSEMSSSALHTFRAILFGFWEKVLLLFLLSTETQKNTR